MGVALLSSNVPRAAPNGQKCGRVAYSAMDLANLATADARGPAWPEGGTSRGMTPAEKLLELVLFDLSSCIQDHRATPGPPSSR